MIKKTLGGGRLGSGNKMKAALHNYERSTHDLGNVWRSTMAAGVLVPFFKKLCTNGDTWSIDLKELVRTMPAIGPLFGSYKLQLDVFEVPIRLYNGILHNNMTKIGMDMAKVKLPKINMKTAYINDTIANATDFNKKQISPSSLMCYLGLRGIGRAILTEETPSIVLERKINAVPVLAYYDIFKNYYANKQEENAYVIANNIELKQTSCVSLTIKQAYKEATKKNVDNTYDSDTLYINTIKPTANMLDENDNLTPEWKQYGRDYGLQYMNSESYYEFTIEGNYTKEIELTIYDLGGIEQEGVIPSRSYGPEDLNGRNYDVEYTDTSIIIKNINYAKIFPEFNNENAILALDSLAFKTIANYESNYELKAFPLENIDQMRIFLLKNTALGTEITINDFTENGGYPYKANWSAADWLEDNGARFDMQGLVVKTYQSDIFNNWLSSQWIDSIKGINAISAVSVEEGKFTIDALNLAHKVYNMLNRIAISGGTYEDWQEAVYGEDALRRAESPIYCGGASGIIAFEEVVSTADTLTETAGDQPLGSLAGKGTLTNVQGGEIEIHIKEPSYIMGIVSITPYIDYCQGNDFDMTELDSLNDLHKPELDEIGFQDLILERAAWWNTYYDGTAETPEWKKLAGGKLPAWIEYMTSVNQVYGEFAEKDKLGYMVLTRDYEWGDWNRKNEALPVDDDGIEQSYSLTKDWTTYINPTKFNYQFANTSLTAQNFWVQIAINAICRRKISAKLIPNL